MTVRYEGMRRLVKVESRCGVLPAVKITAYTGKSVVKILTLPQTGFSVLLSFPYPRYGRQQHAV